MSSRYLDAITAFTAEAHLKENEVYTEECDLPWNTLPRLTVGEMVILINRSMY